MSRVSRRSLRTDVSADTARNDWPDAPMSTPCGGNASTAFGVGKARADNVEAIPGVSTRVWPSVVSTRTKIWPYWRWVHSHSTILLSSDVSPGCSRRDARTIFTVSLTNSSSSASRFETSAAYSAAVDTSTSRNADKEYQSVRRQTIDIGGFTAGPRERIRHRG